MSSGLSKYAVKLAARRRHPDSYMFQPHSINGEETPTPRPLLSGYFAKYFPDPRGSNAEVLTLMKHEFENRRQINFFRMPHKAQ